MAIQPLSAPNWASDSNFGVRPHEVWADATRLGHGKQTKPGSSKTLIFLTIGFILIAGLAGGIFWWVKFRDKGSEGTTPASTKSERASDRSTTESIDPHPPPPDNPRPRQRTMQPAQNGDERRRLTMIGCHSYASYEDLPYHKRVMYRLLAAEEALSM